MIRTFGRSVVLTVSLALIAGCQSTNHVVDTLRIKQAESGLNSNATIYCSGAQLCEFERLNTTPIVDAQKHRVSEQALHQGIVRLEGSVFSPVNSMYLSVPPQQYELVIRFYPISRDRAETFHVIHQFKANQRYTFKMYRDRSKHSGGSLLNVSAPEPLCVELEQENRPIRRFCRPFDAITGLGEFIEQRI
ncbi:MULTISPECIES: hypothetical protein [Acinetobacter]|uniref:hypothetical protein n=1 Tax=Acinetobacter TaxID=469 RepID=UPI0002D09544|nr:MULTISPECIES: hypothetical protein [Acinetobacter]ENV58584.1 hypothetical protein F951_00250 [Acinetobacter soli CIP 110264]MBO3671511.1 hypothetical protein [Acinetobacter soli]MBU3119286.1 hypothetical protein [Acinetobacter soli]MBV6551551.1 hypothetical protein [Acinetobacter soli]MDI3379506.1 hypothetical protein [Acinetobacter sp. V89_7]